MQVFVPYPSPIDVAKCLDKRRLRKQIIECNQILKAIYGESKAWANHPVVNMYRPYIQFLAAYSDTLWAFQNGCDYWVQGLSELADAHRPLSSPTPSATSTSEGSTLRRRSFTLNSQSMEPAKRTGTSWTGKS